MRLRAGSECRCLESPRCGGKPRVSTGFEHGTTGTIQRGVSVPRKDLKSVLANVFVDLAVYREVVKAVRW